MVKEVVEERKMKLADGCQHVFLDVGANIGVHGRFLFEPHLYPDAVVAQKIFEKHLGPATLRDNRDICVFAFEPNPAHFKRHRTLEEAYKAQGWRYHPVLAGVSDSNGTLTFFHNNDAINEEWGFGVNKLDDKSTPVEVPTIRLAKWLNEEILDRKLPLTAYGNYTSVDPKVIMKLDIEGMEYAVIPDLMFSGTLCRTVDYIFGEFHDWTNVDLPPNEKTGRGGLRLKPRRENILFRDNLLKAFNSLRSPECKTVEFDLKDDESYLHDGVPLPGEQNDSVVQAIKDTSVVNIEKVSNSTTPLAAAPGREAMTVRIVKKAKDVGSDKDLKSPSNNQETAIVCAIVKDEDRYLREWILYNLGLGFNKIYIYDNSANSTTSKWLNTQDSKVRRGTVVHKFPESKNERQIIAYRDCIERFGRGNNHAWATFLDPDEFLVLKKHETVVDFLQDLCVNGSVSINWVNFGTSNHTKYEPLPVTQRFQYHTGIDSTVKTIVRISDFVRQRSPHWAFLKNDTQRRDTHGNFIQGKGMYGTFNPTFHEKGTTDIAAVHHYRFKSSGEFNAKYCSRGDVWHTYNNMTFCQNGKQTVVPDVPVGYIHDASAWELLQKNVPEYRENVA